MVPIIFCSIPRRMQFEESGRRSKDGMGRNLNLFRTRTRGMENLEALGSEISDADMGEIDIIFDGHGAITLSPCWLED
jgi:hypothetical protein